MNRIPASIDLAATDADIDAVIDRARYAAGTTRTVGPTQARFRTWCEARGLDSLPAAPATVGAYLAWMAAGEKDADGTVIRQPYALATIRAAKAAIGITHARAGLPSPATDTWVCLVMAGIARSPWLHRSQPMSPLGAAQMRRLMASPPPKAELSSLRDQAFLLVAAATGWPLGDVLALRRDQVRVSDDAVVLAPRPGQTVELPQLAAATLRQLKEALPARVTLAFGVRGTESSPQFVTGASAADIAALTATVRQSLRKSANLDVRTRRPLPPMTAQEFDHLLLRRDRRRVRWLRDRALLLTAWHLALRGSEIGDIRLEDLRRDDRGYTAWLGRTKNDQIATGTPLSLLRTQDPQLDPVTALDAWLAYRRPAGPGAVFCRIDGAQCRPENGVTAGDDVLDIVKAWTSEAGLEGRYGGHSLRIGFVVSAIRGGASIAQIMTVTRQRSPEMVGYYGRAQVAAKRRAPKALVQRARQESA